MLRLILLFLFPALLSAQQIPTTAFTVQTTKGADNAVLSFDGNANTSFFPGWSTDPGEFVVTFDGEYELSKIKYLDGSGRPSLVFYANNEIVPFKTILLHQYLVWGEEKIDVRVTSLRVQLQGIQGDKVIPELVLYGKKIGTSPVIPSPPTPAVQMGNVSARINLCGFSWSPLQKMKPFAFKRDFQMASFTWSPMGFSPQPLYGGMSTNVQGYDDYLTACKAQNLQIVPCVNETPAWFWNYPQGPTMYSVGEEETYPFYNPKASIIFSLDTVSEVTLPAMYDLGYHPKRLPAGPGASRTDPSAYIDYARFMFQYAARYGRQTWHDEAIQVNPEPLYPNSPINQKRSGLDLLKYIEPWNEPEPFWLDESIYATPEQFAAFMSAVYDGHCGTLGNLVGIKEADSTMIVVMPGLTNADTSYVKRMVLWCQQNRRDGLLAWDITNFHWYSNTGNIAGVWPPKKWEAGLPADKDPGWSDVEAFVEYGHSLGQQVWWTEFGYDSRPPSWQYAVPYAGKTSEQLQADWLVRNYLMGIRAGIDNMFMFNGNNEPGATNGGLYQNSGLLYGVGDDQPFGEKPAYKAVTKLISDLAGYDYAADQSLPGNVMILKFHSKANKPDAYAVWMSTINGASKQVVIAGRTYTATETPQIIYDSRQRKSIPNPGFVRKLIFSKQSPRLKN